MTPRRDHTLRIAAAAALAATSAAAASANSLTVNLVGRVAERCDASLQAVSASGASLAGQVQTQCNTRFRLTLRYAPELGAASGVFAGQPVAGDHGELVLAADAPPSYAAAALTVTFSDAPASGAPVQLIVAPLGL